jgi:hypothetical protein
MTTEEIRLQIDASRRAIQADYASLRAEMDVAAKTKRAIVENPLPWLGGAAMLGFLFSGRRKEKVRKIKVKGGGEVKTVEKFTFFGALLAMLRFLLPLARPTIQAIATQKITEFASRRMR